MAQNPRFNNSDMFNNSNDYSDITPDSKSEVLATQGNVINSIKVFWNKLRAKLAFAITRPDYGKAVGGNYQPVYVNNSGDVAPCSPSVFQTTVNGSTINLPESFPIYAGQVICFNVTNGSGDNSGDLKIGNISVYYPTGATVKGSDVIGGSYLFTYISGNGDKWILNNKINVVSGDNDGLMTVDEHNKLAGIAEHANNFTYTLPTANASDLGGVKSSNNNSDDNNRKVYHVGVDNNGIMTVNVPWKDTHNTAGLSVVPDNNGHPIIRLNDGGNTTDISIVPMLGAQAYIGAEGQIVLAAPNAVSYNYLKNDDWNKEYDETTGYVVLGPGKSKATGDYFLAGDGSWQRGTPSKYMEYDTTNSRLHMEGSYVCGDLQVKTSTGGSIDFFLIKSSGEVLDSSSNKLTLSPSHSLSLNRAYPILSRQQNAGVREVRPGFIIFTNSNNSTIGTIY